MALSFYSERMTGASGNPFARNTTEDHSATLWVVTLLSAIYAALILAVRLGYTKRKAYALDDKIISMAYVLAFGMWVSLWTSLQHGLGRSYSLLDEAEIRLVQKSFFISRIFLFVSLFLSKSSIIALVRGLFAENRRISVLTLGAFVIVATWGLFGIITITIVCPIDTIIPRRDHDYCLNFIPWLEVVTAIDVITEAMIIGLPMVGFHSSQMSIGRKAIVMMAFLTRMPNIAFATKHLLAYSKSERDHQSAISIIAAVVWQSISLSYNLMSATTPLLKGFTQGFTTGGVASGYSRNGTISEGSDLSGTYKLRSLTRPKLRPGIPDSMLQDVTEPHVYDTLVLGNAGRKSAEKGILSHDDQRYHESASVTSQDSRQIMIKHEWRVVVE